LPEPEGAVIRMSLLYCFVIFLMRHMSYVIGH
jgi:hypothetical protein